MEAIWAASTIKRTANTRRGDVGSPPNGGEFETPDIYDHDFSDGTAGGLQDGNGDSIIGNGWSLVANTGDADPDWDDYVNQNFNGPVDDGGAIVQYKSFDPGSTGPDPGTDFYMALKVQLNGIAAQGTNSKWIRFQSLSISGGFFGGIGYRSNGNDWQFDFNNLNSSVEWTFGQVGGQALAPADLIGTQFVFEIHVEYGLPNNAARITIWINGTQVNVNPPGGGTATSIFADQSISGGWNQGGPDAISGVDILQFDGTTDLPAGTGSMRLARYALSTQRIGWV